MTCVTCLKLNLLRSRRELTHSVANPAPVAMALMMAPPSGAPAPRLTSSTRPNDATSDSPTRARTFLVV